MSRRFSSLFRKNNDWVPGAGVEMMTFSTFLARYGVVGGTSPRTPHAESAADVGF